MEQESIMIQYLPVVIQFLIAGGFVVTTLVVTHFLGPRQVTRKKLDAFECGIESVGNARMPFSVKYFLTAILFVLFDVEIIFMYPWAVNFREFAQHGLQGFFSMLVFLGFLLMGFLYIIKKGALKWED